MKRNGSARVLSVPFFTLLALFLVGPALAKTARHLSDPAEIQREGMDLAVDATEQSPGTSRAPDSAEVSRDDASCRLDKIMPSSSTMEATPETLQGEGLDERILWRLLNRHEPARLRKMIGRWRERNPDWQPPADLLRYLKEQERAVCRQQEKQVLGQRQKELGSAFLRNDVQEVIAISHAYGKFFNCEQVDNVKAILPLYAFTHSSRELLRLVISILATPSCTDEAKRFHVIETAKDYLDVETLDALLDYALPLFASEAMRGSLRELAYRHHIPYLAEELARGGDADATRRLVDELAGPINTHRDAAIALPIAWFFEKQNQFDIAAHWFRVAYQCAAADSPIRGEAVYGRALVLHRQGRNSAALELACTHLDGHPKIRSLYKEILLEEASALYRAARYDEVLVLAGGNRLPLPALDILVGKSYMAQAWQAYRRGEYDKSRVLAKKATLDSEQRNESATLLAWLDFSRKDYRRAQERFEGLRKVNPSAEFDGAILACRQAQRQAETGGDGEADTALTLYHRKRFLAAYNLSLTRAPLPGVAVRTVSPPDEPLTLLRNIDSPLVGGDIIYRNKRGESGTSRLQTLAMPVLEGTYIHNHNHAFSLFGHRLQLKSGILNPLGTPAGSAGVLRGGDRALVQAPNIEVADQQIYRLEYQQDGWWSPYGGIGLAPVNGTVDPAFTFRLGMRKQRESGGWRLELFSKPVMDSILSFSGMKDPYSDRKWGRVLRSGGEGSLLCPLADEWVLVGTARGGILRGKGVDDNWMVHLAGGLDYNLRLPGFDYFSVGPGFQYEHYDKNRSHFTLGHGGYFSPDRYYNLGLGVYFLTDEGRDFIAKGHVTVGYQSIDNSAAELFPGQPAMAGLAIQQSGSNQLTSYAADSSRGGSYECELTGSWLFTSRWQLKSGIAYRKTNGYEDYYAGLGLSYSLRPRAASFSRDLPKQMFELLY